MKNRRDESPCSLTKRRRRVQSPSRFRAMPIQVSRGIRHHLAPGAASKAHNHGTSQRPDRSRRSLGQGRDAGQRRPGGGDVPTRRLSPMARLCCQSLAESKRTQAQRWLARRTDADRASTSGEHLGRLAGFRNWKRSGAWVNTVASSAIRPWDPAPALKEPAAPSRPRTAGPSHRGTDTNPSGRDSAWKCSLFEAGHDPGSVYHRLVERTRSKRGSDAERYARHTVNQAVAHIGVGRPQGGATTSTPRVTWHREATRVQK